MIPAIALDQVVAAAHDVTFNQVTNGMAQAALFGIKLRQSVGLRLTLYGGVFPATTGTPTIVSDAAIDLTPSDTNYIYVDTAGVVFKVTTAPDGWPGPMDAGYRALYELIVGADAVTSGTSYVVGPASEGPQGPIGATGPAGDELWVQRKRVCESIGGGATNTDTVGFATTFTADSGPTARVIGATYLAESVPFMAYGGTGAGGSGQFYSSNFCFLGNAAGRGGFDVTCRWCFEASFSVTNIRRFIGLYDTAAGIFGNVEPDTILNLVGVGSKAGDANLSIIHNDGSGTATMATLGANFPAKATDNLYELRLLSVANSGTVTYTLTDVGTGNQASATLSTDLPATTQFLGWYLWTNNGSSSGTGTIGFMQVTSKERY